MKHIIAFIIVLSLATTSYSQEWRPCGGEKTNRFVPQGWKGADFRPACAQHDKHYHDLNPTISRKQADLIFLRSMLEACDSSSQPVRAKMKARNMYRVVRLLGGRFYGGAG